MSVDERERESESQCRKIHRKKKCCIFLSVYELDNEELDVIVLLVFGTDSLLIEYGM